MKIGIVIAVFVAGLVFGLLHHKKLLSKLKENETFIVNKSKAYKTKDSLNAFSIYKLNLSLKEYKTKDSENLKQIKKLKIDLKRVSSVSTSETVTEYKIKTVFRDSLIKGDSVKCFKFNNNLKYVFVYTLNIKTSPNFSMLKPMLAQ